MTKAIIKCPSCGNTMNPVRNLSARPGMPYGEPLKPLRYVCRCGNVVKL